MDYSNLNSRSTIKKQEINIREILDFFWRLKYWIIISLATTVGIAIIYLRMLTPIYERTTWVMMNREEGKNTEMYLLTDYQGKTTSKKNDSELFSELYILKSPTVMSKVVSELGINTRYYKYIKPFGNSFTAARNILNIKKVEFYNNSPFELEIERNPLYPTDMQPGSIFIEFKNIGGKEFKVREFTVNGKKFKEGISTYSYGDSISMGAFSLVLDLSENTADLTDGGKYVCTWSSPINTAKTIVRNMNASVQGKGKNLSDIIEISIKDNNRNRADDILNTLVRVVNDESREYKNAIINNTIAFIDQRLSVISSELGDAENDYKNYQTSRVAIDLESQTQMAVKGDMDYQKQLTEVQLQLRILDMISGYLNESTQGEYKVIPANVGISDAGLNNIINQYNALVTERNLMIASSSESNPRVVSTRQQLDDSKKAIELSVTNLLRMYGIREKELERVISNSQRKMAQIPQQQYELQQLSRRMEVIEPLFQLLQQKREEAQMMMYSSNDDLRVIESSFGTGGPVFPDSRLILFIAFAIGLFISPFIVWVRLMLDNKVQTKYDLEGNVNASLLACLPKNEKTDYALIPTYGHDNTSEAFRMLRSNIQYLEGVKVIQVTSSVFGEGKSYVASNLALSIAHTGRKVILVGMDLRKPALYKIFPGVRPKPKNNVVGFLTGKCVKLGFAIENSGVCDTLDVLMSGPVPPNPTEILSFDKQKELIEKLRERYDYVIIDSAPYLLASDSMLINSYVDSTLYILRADFTEKSLFGEINDAINSKHKPMKNVYLVLNGLDQASAKFRYGYGKGYGKEYYSSYNYSYGQA
jgi:capsular exopolysaccharide synthesis family protein